MKVNDDQLIKLSVQEFQTELNLKNIIFMIQIEEIYEIFFFIFVKR